jgi:hypothetical protein
MLNEKNIYRPVLRANWRRKRALIVNPDAEFGSLLYKDANPDFELITFSYANKDLNLDLLNGLHPHAHYKFESEFWGESFFRLCNLINGKYDVVCFFNSDLYVGVSSLNHFFEMVDFYNLDFSQPSLSWNSYISHEHTKHIPGAGVVEASFIEIMMPCLSAAVISEIVNLKLYTISGWGLDCFLFPYIQRKLNLLPPAIIHTCQVCHSKPISSNIIYSNGLSAYAEMINLGDRIKSLDAL